MDWLRDIHILPQPDNVSCGPTCLHAIYNYYDDPIPIQQVIDEVPSLKEGGTLAVMLGCHALKRGYGAKIYTYNLQVFDPTWFQGKVNLQQRLKEQTKRKKSRKLHIASKVYIDFLNRGGKILFEDLTPKLITKHLRKNVPILTGLSATYLYREKRERITGGQEDDLRGEPSGHFVVLCGYDKESKKVLIADPLESNPLSGKQLYAVHASRVIGAILLGIVTYDANLLILEPPARKKS